MIAVLVFLCASEMLATGELDYDRYGVVTYMVIALAAACSVRLLRHPAPVFLCCPCVTVPYRCLYTVTAPRGGSIAASQRCRVPGLATALVHHSHTH